MAFSILVTDGDGVLDQRTRLGLRTVLALSHKAEPATRLTELGVAFVAARSLDTDAGRACCKAIADEIEAKGGDATNILTSVIDWIDAAKHLGATHAAAH